MNLLSIIPTILLSATSQATASDPTKAHEKLLGDWVGGASVNHDGQELEVKAVAKGVKYLRDKWVKADVSYSGGPDGNIEAAMLLSFDQQTKRYRGYFFISQSPSALVGTGESNGKSIIFLCKGAEDEPTIKVDLDFSKTDEFTFTMFVDRDGTFPQVMKLSLKRKVDKKE